MKFSNWALASIKCASWLRFHKSSVRISHGTLTVLTGFFNIFFSLYKQMPDSTLTQAMTSSFHVLYNSLHSTCDRWMPYSSTDSIGGGGGGEYGSTATKDKEIMKTRCRQVLYGKGDGSISGNKCILC
jgi:hypothetical protein